ncbi:MAG: NACHT domain-containing protein, partial [Anaerolineae bacterium]|nr:NACHT domain-containing protein [Anaerolineae bacterium]
PGRGYLQVGNENIEMIQVAFSGAEYVGYNLYDEGELLDLTKYADRDVIWLDRLAEPTEPPKLFEVLVKEMERVARVHSIPQKKPWPSPLPEYIGLNDPIPEPEYLHPDDIYELRRYLIQENDPLTLNPAVTGWDRGTKQAWDGLNWKDDAMSAVVGLIDDPGNARQHLLKMELRRGHVALFGASGWGKTTFLRSLALSLAATHSPEELHIYILDFGGRNLEVMRDLPHVGAIIMPDEEERVLRLLRKLDSLLEERKQILSQAQASSLFSYNLSHTPLPAILVMIDNFAEFRENFENAIPLLTSLIREGLSNGLHFVVTGEQTNTIPGRMFSLFTERLTP